MMKKLFLALAFFILLVTSCFAATWTAAAGGGNWNSNDTWEEGGGYPVAGDTALLISTSGAVTVNVASECDDITATGYTGTLTLSAGLTVYGNLLFVAGMTFTPGTQTVTFAATTSGKTVTSGGKAFWIVTWNGSGGEWTLQDYFHANRETYMTAGTLLLNGQTYDAQRVQTITLGNGFTLVVGTGYFYSHTIASMTIGTGATVTVSTGIFDIVNLTISTGGALTCSGNSVIRVRGSWNVSAGIFTKDTSTVTFTATASGKTITSGSNTYYNVAWDGSGGEWTLQDNFTQTRTTAFTLGTLNLNGKTYTNESSTQTVTLGNGFTLNIGTGYLYAYPIPFIIPTGATVNASTPASTYSMIVYSFTVSGTGTFTATGAAIIVVRNGEINITSPNFTAGTSTLMQYSGSSTLFSNQPLYNYQVGRSVTANVIITLNSDITVLNNFTILYQAGYTRSFSAGSYTINVGGNWANGDTFTAGTSTVNFNDATKVSTITGTTTFNILQCLTPNKTVKFYRGQTFTVASFDFTGAAGQLITIDSDNGTNTFTLSDSTGTNQVEYCNIKNSVATGGATWNAFTTDGNVDGGGNSGWIFTAPAAGGFSALMLSGD